jgi:hypothetical protein
MWVTPAPLISEGTAIKPERLVAAAREPIHGLVRSYSPDSWVAELRSFPTWYMTDIQLLIKEYVCLDYSASRPELRCCLYRVVSLLVIWGWGKIIEYETGNTETPHLSHMSPILSCCISLELFEHLLASRRLSYFTQSDQILARHGIQERPINSRRVKLTWKHRNANGWNVPGRY